MEGSAQDHMMTNEIEKPTYVNFHLPSSKTAQVLAFTSPGVGLIIFLSHTAIVISLQSYQRADYQAYLGCQTPTTLTATIIVIIM